MTVVVRRVLAPIFAAVLAAALAGAMAPPSSTAVADRPSPRVADRDCGDFSTQAAAQRFFLDHGGPRNDPHRLDADGDGIACESNPCPCNYDTTPGGGGGGGDGGGGGGGGTGGGPRTLKQKARVVKVIDGDTVRVKLKGGPRRDVRVIGIDTPEVYGGVECGGRQASSSARQLLPRGTWVTLISDTTQQREDRYNRLLRYIEKRGFDIGRAQLRRGWAKVYVYDRKPSKRTRGYQGTQAEAKQARRGAWGLC